jgi:hypothetical protein
MDSWYGVHGVGTSEGSELMSERFGCGMDGEKGLLCRPGRAGALAQTLGCISEAI